MEFRRGGHRTERRRRVLIEEPGARAAAPRQQACDCSRAESTRRYTDAVSRRQPQVIDLIPTRWWTNLLLLALLLLCAAGIEAIYGYVALGQTAFAISELPAIDLSARGSIATWFSSAVFCLCAVYGLLIYQIRRHRADDYRGRYRMWYWVVPLFVLASIDQVADIQGTVWNALCQVTPAGEYTNAESLWSASLVVVTVAVIGRLLIETWSSSLASLLLMISLSCVAMVNASRVGWLQTDAGVWGTITVSSLTMGWQIALLMTLFLYGRHVHREAHGQLRPAPKGRRGKTVRRKHSEGEQEGTASSEAPQGSTVRRAGGRAVRTDPPHTSRKKSSSGPNSSSGAVSSDKNGRSPRKENRRGSTTNTRSGNGCSSPAPSAEEETVRDADEQPSRKLSKAERKRLRKQRRRERET